MRSCRLEQDRAFFANIVERQACPGPYRTTEQRSRYPRWCCKRRTLRPPSPRRMHPRRKAAAEWRACAPNARSILSCLAPCTASVPAVAHSACSCEACRRVDDRLCCPKRRREEPNVASVYNSPRARAVCLSQHLVWACRWWRWHRCPCVLPSAANARLRASSFLFSASTLPAARQLPLPFLPASSTALYQPHQSGRWN